MSSEPEGKNVEARLELARQLERERVLEHVDEILKHEWANATNLDNPYRDDRHMVISRIRNTVAIYRKELRKGEP